MTKSLGLGSRSHQGWTSSACRDARPCTISLASTRSVIDQTDRDGKQRMSEKPEDIDPGVVEHVIAIRDRFGIRGLRDADALIREEIKLAELAMKGLPVD